MPLTGGPSLCSRSGLGCSRLVCLGLQNPALCRWGRRSSGTDRSPLALGVQLPLLRGCLKPVPAQARLQLCLGSSPDLCFTVEVAGGSFGDSQTHSFLFCFVVLIRTNCFHGIVFLPPSGVELPELSQVIS